MATVDDLNARLEALKKARGSGLRSVEYAGRRTEYRSDAELAAAITATEQDLASVQGTSIVRTFRFTSSKDL